MTNRSPSCITSDEVNFLIYRYLCESGFSHSAYNFASESLVNRSNINGANIPPGALIAFLQKGLQYVEIESSLQNGFSQENENKRFSLVDKEVCEILTGSGRVQPSSLAQQANASRRTRRSDEQKSGSSSNSKKGSASPLTPTSTSSSLSTMSAVNNGSVKQEPGIAQGFPDSSIAVLTGHKQNAFTTSWNPKRNILATGSQDSTARLWDFSNVPLESIATLTGLKVFPLPHSNNSNSDQHVISIHWNPSGTFFATGCSDFIGRVWTSDGTLVHSLKRHTGPVFSLKFNPSGNYLASASVDHSIIVWNASNGDCIQQFSLHTQPAVDISWKSDDIFASCSVDKTIQICQVGSNTPLRTWKGLEKEVASIAWDPRGELLASNSEQEKALLWSFKEDKCVHVLAEHTQPISTIKWSPLSDKAPLMLATASYDATVKLWDPDTGKCLQTLNQQSDPVYAVSFSPDGLYIATGSYDRSVNIYSTTDGTLLRRYKSKREIFDVSWNYEGDMVAACIADHTVVVLSVPIREFQAQTMSVEPTRRKRRTKS